MAPGRRLIDYIVFMEIKGNLKRPPLPNRKLKNECVDLFEEQPRENYLLPRVSRMLQLHAKSIEKSHWTPSSENIIRKPSVRKPGTASRESIRSGKMSEKVSIRSDYSE
jgi:hypothetical protein